MGAVSFYEHYLFLFFLYGPPPNVGGKASPPLKGPSPSVPSLGRRTIYLGDPAFVLFHYVLVCSAVLSLGT
jgi:hypothetical protein